jgi:predicted component of type VI protein secretion system
MVELRIVSGKMAGTSWSARRFPVRIGRAANSDLRLEEDGVWDDHLLLDFERGEGFILSAQPNALTQVNGQSVEQTRLRNGDEITLGSLKLLFSLARTRQASLRWREILTWTGLALVTLGQLALLYLLLR